MDPSRLGRENDVHKELIHINEILIDLSLEKRKIANVSDGNEIENWNRKHEEVITQLIQRKEHLIQLILGAIVN